MKSYKLKYGNTYQSFELPSQWDSEILTYREPGPLPAQEALINSLKNPIDAKPLDIWLKDFKKILIICPDITRYSGLDYLLPLIYERFLRDKDLRVIFALGNHRKQTDEERMGIISETLFKIIPNVDHDCFDPDALSFFGRTSSGLEVLLNKMLVETDAAIVTGSINFHYLAGFGGGRKSIFPGIAGYETILGIHSKVFNRDKPGKHEKAKSGILKGNPMHEEIMEGIALIRTPMFLINTVIDDKKNLLNIFSGDLRTAHETGCAWYLEHFGVRVRQKADIVIVSSGGFPKDINFIQTHKAIEHGLNAVSENGYMIVVGRCEDGLGNADFLRWFEYPTIEDMEPHVRTSDKVYSQTAYATRLKARYCNIILVSDLDGEMVKKMGITPARTVQEAIDSIRHAIGPKKRPLCYIIPNGSNMLVQ
ncbi:MAG TPA: nickel-dependent lactate racemase [Syntrophorhabdaceae bacterium]|nr:nickel-dependent lactate racemase [Syntrophorhabdaceae bacterium]HOL06619.1 nickel-dependent lactate racemase [Syntrophorhabdaceae bacterium]HON86241.1 nickel-dependent lactate racemase [Syntrophorhabdaceae bacterium]HOT42661.1 nickel-dependent lactate racemase [Syntrophorhabdaceae bacterium]HPC66448.1 nickel-dependent lactate racemase [Syntrophorhabdaceae bacterium]